MSTWITPLQAPGTGPRVAVKDAIDVEGVPTTAGCAAVADVAAPAEGDAACLAGFRAAGARLVGKANLHELCFGVSGINEWFGTPVNPLDGRRQPGGSSSGSAVAVASGDADVAIGTDTGGSVRIPAACCGVAGLKTTWGRVPLDGVWPLAPALDTVGPLARDVAGLAATMSLLDRSFSMTGWTAGTSPAVRVGRVRVANVDPVIDAAVDAALRLAELDVVDIELPGWDAASRAFGVIIVAEAWQSNQGVLERAAGRVSAAIRDRLHGALDIAPDQLAEARVVQSQWQASLKEVFDRVELLALPTLECFAPLLAERRALTRCTAPFNVAGTPALAIPIPASTTRDDGLPASLQLVASWGEESRLCAVGSLIETAVG